MTGKRQQIEQEEVRAARPITIRALSILAAVAAFAVSAAPASANNEWRKAPPKPRFIEIGTTETLDMNARVTAKGHAAGKVATPRKPRRTLDNPASGGF